MKETLAAIAAILAVVGNIPYLRDVLARRVQPHPYTWFVWSIVSCVTFFGQVAKGAGVGAVPTAVAEGFTIVIFLFSLRYGFRDIRRQDSIFLVVALLGLVPWWLTDDPTLSVVTVVGIDLVAFLPTLRKAWVRPASEAPLLYAMNVSRHVLALFSLQAYNVATMLHSLAMIAANSAMAGILLARGCRGAARKTGN